MAYVKAARDLALDNGWKQERNIDLMVKYTGAKARYKDLLPPTKLFNFAYRDRAVAELGRSSCRSRGLPLGSQEGRDAAGRASRSRPGQPGSWRGLPAQLQPSELRARYEISGPDPIALPTGWEGSCSSNPRETSRGAAGRRQGRRD